METNKILGAIILALLLAAVFSKVADMAIHPEYPEELAYQIDIPEVSASGAQAEEVDIFAVLPEITPLLASNGVISGRTAKISTSSACAPEALTSGISIW